MLAERYLDPQYAPDAVAARTGIAAATIRRLAAELADAAFAQEVVIETPWTDWAGRRHDRFVGRPVSMHAMRGISAHANGFQTCRALHLLQLLLGSIDCPGGFRFKPPYPKPAPPGLRPTGKPGQVAPDTPLPGRRSASRPGPRICSSKPTAGAADRQGVSWEYPMAAHGMMQMVIANAWRGDPYRIDTLFMYMANMSWNSAMNTAETMRMLTDQTRQRATTRSPASSIPTPSIPRWWRTPIWCCRTRRISSAGTASACSTGRSVTPTGRPTRSASPSSRPTATFGRSRTC